MFPYYGMKFATYGWKTDMEQQLQEKEMLLGIMLQGNAD